MDTMLSFASDNLATQFLSNDGLHRLCPMAFKEAPTNPGVSGKYLQANTMTVVNDLEKLGWFPVQAKQCREKKNSSGIRSFHMIAFQNPDVKITKTTPDGGETVDAYPRIILTNSHDGFNSFKFMVGLFRLVCSNGLVMGSDELVNMSIRHINYTFEALRGIVVEAIDRIPGIVAKMNGMKKATVSEEDQRAIAIEVEKIRKNVDPEDKNFSVAEDVIKDILTPLRKEDEGNDLWSVFNRCQEKMIKGGYLGNSLNGDHTKFRKRRRITSIKKDLEYNQRLWEFASRLVPVEAA